MSWQITEDLDKLKFNRYFPEFKVFIIIELDHGPDSLNLFEGEMIDENNELIVSTTGTTFYDVMNRLLNRAQCGF